MKWAGLVPVRRLSSAKQRLRKSLDSAQVEALGRCMLEDVLGALCRSGLDGVFTVTDDPSVAAASRGAGAEPILIDPDPGLNPSIEAAEAELRKRGFEATLVVPADLPLLGPEHVQIVLEAAREHTVVVVPAADGGTAMLARHPIGSLPTRFGADSAHAHWLAAHELARSALLLDWIAPWVRRDLDTFEDARALLEAGRLHSPPLTSRTLELLKGILA